MNDSPLSFVTETIFKQYLVVRSDGTDEPGRIMIIAAVRKYDELSSLSPSQIQTIMTNEGALHKLFPKAKADASIVELGYDL